MEIIAKSALITINETFFIQLVSFLVFLYIINKIMYRPLKQVMADRDAHIEDLKKGIVDAKSEVKRFAEEIEKRRSDVREEAMSESRSLEDMGSKEAQSLFEVARDQSAKITDKAKAEFETKIAEAKKQITRESQLLAVSIMEKVLERRLAP